MKGFSNFKTAVSSTALVCLAAVCLMKLDSCSCSSDYAGFRKAMAAGELTQAQSYLIDMGSGSNVEDCAIQLIEAYLKIDMPDKAISVYENITSWHKDRYNMQWTGGEYERKACKLLREYLIAHGQYEKAWNYYPLEYEDENYRENAQAHFAYISDVVADMCSKGQQDDAAKFVENQIRWFVTYVDSDTYEDSENLKSSFGSDVVRQKLLNQIDNSY